MFIPHEVKEKIENLEQEVKKLRAENQDLKNAELLKPKKRTPVGAILFAILFFISFFINAYLYFYPVTEVETEDNTAFMDSVTMHWDGELVKLDAVPQEGLVYRVQIGAYAEFNLNEYQANLDAISQDSSTTFTKVSLGGFSNIVDAQAFQQEMAKMGLETAYIVAYQDGSPVGVLEPLEINSTDTIN